jgi:hypothetical protein
MFRDRVDLNVDVPMGDSGKKRTYAYRPYKWRQPETLRTGTIFAHDEKGGMIGRTVLEDGEIGITATYTLANAIKTYGISDVLAQRLDLRKIKVTWNFDNEFLEYDHFILIKEVNKERNFIGAVMSTSYIDVLESEEAGTIIYYVIPVIRDYSIASPSASNAILIDPEELEASF